MKLKDIKIKGKIAYKISPEDVTSVEKKLKTKFPSGYAEYITTLGEGVLGGTYVRIYPPFRIVRELKEWRKRMKEYWFWDEGRPIVTQKHAVECIILGDTMDGDEIIFHPKNPERLVVLPRNLETAFEAGNGLFEALDWLCTSGKLTKAFKQRNFEPFDSSKE